jgi:hypothetical protein
MAIGDAWRVTVPVWRYVKPPIDGYVTDYIGGSVYNYGIGKANYPVPAKITTYAYWFSDHDRWWSHEMASIWK